MPKKLTGITKKELLNAMKAEGLDFEFKKAKNPVRNPHTVGISTTASGRYMVYCVNEDGKLFGTSVHEKLPLAYGHALKKMRELAAITKTESAGAGANQELKTEAATDVKDPQIISIVNDSEFRKAEVKRSEEIEASPVDRKVMEKWADKIKCKFEYAEGGFLTYGGGIPVEHLGRLERFYGYEWITCSTTVTIEGNIIYKKRRVRKLHDWDTKDKRKAIVDHICNYFVDGYPSITGSLEGDDTYVISIDVADQIQFERKCGEAREKRYEEMFRRDRELREEKLTRERERAEEYGSYGTNSHESVNRPEVYNWTSSGRYERHGNEYYDSRGDLSFYTDDTGKVYTPM